MSLRFDGLRSTHPRRAPSRAIVIHWTGGARPPAGVYETLRARKGPHTPDGLSIHYVVGSDGDVVQMAAHELVCLHAGVANEWSIGIENVSPGLAMGSAYAREAKDGVHREVYVDRVRGSHPVRLLDFTAPQSASLEVLVEQLCDLLAIPRRVPLDAAGELLRREMTPDELDDFAGVMGHYHCHPTKLDPGTRFLDRLRRKWATAIE